MLYILVAVLVIILGFVLFFNRNPPRKPPRGRRLVVSPADGRLQASFIINSVQGFFRTTASALAALDAQAPLLVVPINLSLLDVHVTRSPCRAKVIDVIHQKGSFLPAICKSSLVKNQRNIIVMRTNKIYFAVIQSTGALARRVRAWVGPGAVVGKGQSIGRILLGSNTSLVIPLRHFELLAASRAKLKGGESILGVLK